MTRCDARRPTRCEADQTNRKGVAAWLHSCIASTRQYVSLHCGHAAPPAAAGAARTAPAAAAVVAGGRPPPCRPGEPARGHGRGSGASAASASRRSGGRQSQPPPHRQPSPRPAAVPGAEPAPRCVAPAASRRTPATWSPISRMRQWKGKGGGGGRARCPGSGGSVCRRRRSAEPAGPPARTPLAPRSRRRGLQPQLPTPRRRY